MLCAVTPLLPLLRPRLTGRLVSAEAWSGIASLAPGLPPAWLWGCFEARLDAGASRVDVAFCLSREHAIGSGTGAAGALATGGDVRDFLARWRMPESTLGAQVAAVWLEYDLPDGRSGKPFLFLCLDRPAPAPPPHSSLRALAAEALPLLLGRPPAPGLLAALDRCAQALPPRGRFLHLAALPPDRGAELRVVALLPPADLAAWLRAAGGSGSLDGVAVALAPAAALAPLVQVQVDLAGGAVARPALEIYLPAQAGWARIVEDLAADGACDPDLGRDAVAWIGEETVRHPQTGRLLHLVRRLFLKVVPAPDGGAQAKAYLAFHAGGLLSAAFS